MRKYLRPRRLEPGDKVAIVASASHVDPVQVALACNVLESRRLVPVLGDNVRFLRSTGMYAAPRQARLDELRWAWAAPDIAGIIVATGGFGCSSLLPDLPYDSIGLCRKPFMGYSDVTALNNALLARSGLVSFNGPTACIRNDTEEHRRNDTQSLEDALDLLMTPGPWGQRPFRSNMGPPRCVFPGRVRGPAVGGNLTTFACLLGTPYFPDIEGAVVFLEDVDEGGYELARTLTHLKLAGVFRSAAGVVLGEFSRQPQEVEAFDPAIEEVIVEFFGEGPPCVYGCRFSHGDVTQVIPIGTMTTLDAATGKIAFAAPFAR